MSRSIIQLTGAQMLGTLISAAGGTGVWMVATALAQPAELAILGRIVSGGGLAAGLISAGLGQFLLLMANHTQTQQLRRYVWFSLIAGGALSAVVGWGLALAQGAPNSAAMITALMACGIAITNLQDALYLGANMSADVPTKSIVLIGFRLALLLLVAALGQGTIWLPAAFVGSQLLVGYVWAILRAPLALRRHTTQVHTQPLQAGAWRTLGFSYLYSSAVTVIMSGIPAFVTALAIPADAGRFYLAWTLAGLLGSIAVSAANAMLATPIRGQRPIRQALGLLSVMVLGALGLVFAAPIVLTLLNSSYGTLGDILAALAIGQIGLGVGLAALATCRAHVLSWRLATALLCWPLLIISAVAIGLAQGGAIGAANGFAVGSLLAAMPLLALAWQVTRSWQQPTTSIAMEAT